MTHLRNSSTAHLSTSSSSFRVRGFARLVALVLTASLLLAGSTMAQGSTPSPRNDGAGFEGVADPALQLFAELGITGEGSDAFAGLNLDHTYVLDHIIPLGDGRFIYAQESFTFRSYLRQPARAALLLNGSAFVSNHWSIPVDGYEGTEILAEEGYFAFTVDYLGVGRSFTPEHGSDAEFEDNAQAMKTVLRYIRHFREVPKIDVIGAGYGGSIGIELAEDPGRVRSVAMSAMIYKELAGGPLADPAFIAFLRSLPTGYAFLPGRSSLIFMQGAPEAAKDYVSVTQGGFYPVDNFLTVTDLPFFDPTDARAPGLVFYGGEDFIGLRSDVTELAEDYGPNGAKLVIKEDAGHAPRAGDPDDAAWYWKTLLDFLDHPHRP